jgi:hypothetical protein
MNGSTVEGEGNAISDADVKIQPSSCNIELHPVSAKTFRLLRSVHLLNPHCLLQSQASTINIHTSNKTRGVSKMRAWKLSNKKFSAYSRCTWALTTTHRSYAMGRCPLSPSMPAVQRTPLSKQPQTWRKNLPRGEEIFECLSSLQETEAWAT